MTSPQGDRWKGRTLGENLDWRPDDKRPQPTQALSVVRVIRVGTILDSVSAAQLYREFRALLARSTYPLVIDLAAVRFVDPKAASSVLRYLAHDAGDADIDLRIVRNPEVVRQVPTLFDDRSLLESYPDIDAALDC